MYAGPTQRTVLMTPSPQSASLSESVVVSALITRVSFPPCTVGILYMQCSYKEPTECIAKPVLWKYYHRFMDKLQAGAVLSYIAIKHPLPLAIRIEKCVRR